MYLVVIHEFAKYKKGDHITNQEEIVKILADERKHRVVKCGSLATPN
jgi:hypothetical protein